MAKYEDENFADDIQSEIIFGEQEKIMAIDTKAYDALVAELETATDAPGDGGEGAAAFSAALAAAIDTYVAAVLATITATDGETLK